MAQGQVSAVKAQTEAAVKTQLAAATTRKQRNHPATLQKMLV